MGRWGTLTPGCSAAVVGEQGAGQPALGLDAGGRLLLLCCGGQVSLCVASSGHTAQLPCAQRAAPTWGVLKWWILVFGSNNAAVLAHPLPVVGTWQEQGQREHP